MLCRSNPGLEFYFDNVLIFFYASGYFTMKIPHKFKIAKAFFRLASKTPQP